MPARRRTVGVIGLGAVAESHLAAYTKLECAQVVGVAEPRAERCQEIASRYGVPGFSSVEELLSKARPDIACILTPVATHRQVTECCAAHGVHVLCEKPMATNIADAQAMAAACRAAGVVLFYGSSYRFLPAIRDAKHLIEEGAVGEVRLIVEQALGGRGPSAYQPMSAEHYPRGGPGGGGWGLVDHGIHMLDVFPWLVSSSIEWVFGRGDRSGEPARPEFAFLHMRNGTVGALLYDDSTWSADLPWEGIFSEARAWESGRGWVGEAGNWETRPGGIRIFGTLGSIRIFHYANKMFVNRAGLLKEHALASGTTPWHFGAQLSQFCDDLDRNAGCTISADDGIRALSALLGIYASERNGQRAVSVD